MNEWEPLALRPDLQVVREGDFIVKARVKDIEGSEDYLRELSYPFHYELRFSEWEGPDEEGWHYTDIRRVYTWTVQVEVDAIWVADGFNLDDDRAKRMLACDLSYAYGHELSAKVLRAPLPKAIAKEQG